MHARPIPTCARAGHQVAPRPVAVPAAQGRSLKMAATTPTTAAALAASFLLLTSHPALAAADAAAPAATPSPSEPSALFTRNCAGCHAGGGNVVAPGATLLAPDLAAAGLDSPGAVFKLIYGGRGRMPGYGVDCAPKGQCTFGPRLSDEDITRLSDYVLAQAAGGWKG